MTEVPDYDYEYTAEQTTQFVTGMVGEVYPDSSWSIDVPHTGWVKYAVTDLPAGLKAYVSKGGSSVKVTGKFTNVLEGHTATLTATDEAGKTYTKKYVFFVGDKNRLVGTVIPQDRLAYVPASGQKRSDYPATGLNIESYVNGINGSYNDYVRDVNGTKIIIAGGSGNYKYELTKVSDVLGAYDEDQDFVAKKDADQKMTAVPAGTYPFTLTVTDRNNDALVGSINYNLNLVDGVTLSGTVKDAAGVPAKYVSIYGTTKSDQYERSYSIYAETKADGTYRTRVMPGDYQMYTQVGGVQSNISVGNVLSAGTATKDFAIPQYCVKFTTNIAGAGAYSDDTYSDSYSTSTYVRLIDAYGNYSTVYVDEATDFGMYAYLRAGSYELVPANEGSTTNTIFAYKKYTTEKNIYGEDIPYIDSNDLIGRYTLSGGAFNVAGNTTVALTGTEYKSSND